MEKALSKEQALLKLTAYCSMAEHCLAEVRKKLTDWEVSEKESEEIIDYLLNEKYVDEVRYAHAFASDKMKFAKWGRTKVAFSLRSNGIDAEIINSTLNEVFNTDDYTNIIQEVLAAKYRTLTFKNRYDAKAKLLRFGGSRGFEFSKMQAIVDKLLSEIPSQGDETNFDF